LKIKLLLLNYIGDRKYEETYLRCSRFVIGIILATFRVTVDDSLSGRLVG